MADPNRGQRYAANWQAVVGEKPEDQIFEENWVLNRLKQGEGFVSRSGGRTLEGNIEYGLNTNARAYSDTDTFDIGRVDVFDVWEANWKEYIVPVTVSQLDKDMNDGEGERFPLMPALMENAKNSLLAIKNADLFGDGTGTSGKVLTGLQALVSSTPTTGTVQGINRATFAFWRNQQTSGAQTVSAFDNLRAAMRTIYNLNSIGFGGVHPSFGVTTLTVFQGYESILVQNERFADKSNGDGGFKNEVIKFKGMKLAFDSDCPSGLMYMLHEKFLKLYYKAGQWMKASPAIEPANQTLEVIKIRSMCQLAATQPRRLGVVTAIT